jgi:DNA-binding winged helix-turn-helix (wHTH) protein
LKTFATPESSMASPARFISKFRFGAFELDAASGELRKAGIPIKLRLQAIQVLLMLTDRAGEVVTREEIRARLWSDDTFVDFERSINFCVNQIRGALGDAAENPRYVETLPRRSYRFIAAVTVELPKEPVTTAAVASIKAGLAHGLDDFSAATSTSSGIQVVPARPVRIPVASWSRKPMLAMIVGAVLAIVAVGFAMHRWPLSNRRLNLENLQITKLTESGKVREMAISPDGLYVTYALRDGINQSLWVREVSTARHDKSITLQLILGARYGCPAEGHFC